MSIYILPKWWNRLVIQVLKLLHCNEIQFETFSQHKVWLCSLGVTKVGGLQVDCHQSVKVPKKSRWFVEKLGGQIILLARLPFPNVATAFDWVAICCQNGDLGKMSNHPQTNPWSNITRQTKEYSLDQTGTVSLSLKWLVFANVGITELWKGYWTKSKLKVKKFQLKI